MNNLAKVIYDSYKGEIPTSYATLSKADREEAIRKEILNVLGLEEFEKKSFRRAWRDNKNKVYAIIEDVAIQVLEQGDYKKNSFFDEFVEVQNYALGDTGLFYVDGDKQLIVSEFSGSHFDLRRTRVDVGQSFTPTLRDYGVKVYEYYERVASGRADIGTLVYLIAEAIDRKLSSLAQATFATAVTNLPATFKFSGTYNEDSIMTVLGHVEASNDVRPTLVGTASALRKLQGTVDIKYSDSMKDSKNNIGLLPVWNGYTCMELKQEHDFGGFNFTLPTNRVFAVTGGDKLVKLLLEGDVETKEISDGTENADRSLETAVAFKAGCLVAYNKMIGVLDFA